MSLEMLKDVLSYIDDALDLLRKCIRENERLEDVLEDVIYHLEEAGELLNTIISEREEEE